MSLHHLPSDSVCGVNQLWVFLGMGPEEEIWPVVLIAGSIVAVLMILAFNDPGNFECVGVCE